MDVSIAVFHHPLRWLAANNGRQFEAHVEASSDLVVTGHEHVVGQFQKTRSSGSSNEYYEGGALHTDTTPFSSEFSIVLLDVENRQHSAITYSWDSGHYQRTASTPPRDFALSPERYAGFKFSGKFQEELTDPGAGFTHPSKPHLSIDDFYIYPDLRELKPVADRGGRVDTIRSKGFISELTKRRKVMIYGDDASGKTALAKAWCRALLTRGIKPLYIATADFSSTATADIVIALRKNCEHQYGASKYEEFSRLSAQDKAIIIDDFHRKSWHGSARRELLETLDALFGTIVIFGSQIVQLEDLSYAEGDDNPLLPFGRFEILPFGYELRRSIVEKWIRIGRDSETDSQNTTRRIKETTSAVNSTIGQDLVPSYPIFILIILQQLEAFYSSAPEGATPNAYGSYGYFYELLITRALANAQEKGIDLDTGYKYLAELAYSMFERRVSLLSRDELRRQHEEYCAEYRLSLEFVTLIELLVKASVIKCESEQYSFKYPYLYYYSVARSLRDDSRHLGEQLPELISTIYTDESAGIIMFLVYLSRDERIISSILEGAQKLYAEFEPCNFGSDVAFLQALSEPSARLRLPESSAEENQIAVSVESDRRSSHSAETLAFYPPSEQEGAAESAALSPSSEIDSLLHLNIAFKMIQILGQIIKNFPGSTKGSLKFTIARECYSLGLRAMNGLLNLISNNQDPLKKDLEKWLHARGVDPSEVGGRAEGLIRWLSEACALTFVLKTAEAVGLPKLGKTYDEILVKDTSVAVRMIDLAVRLEHMPAFPENELATLRKAVYNIPFARSVLTRLAYRHFYLYETGYRLRQRVCSSLDIAVPNRRTQRALSRGTK